MSTLNRQLRWYIGIRLVVMSSMALPYYLGRLSTEIPTVGEPQPGFFGELFGFTCLATLLYIAMLRWLETAPELQAYIQFTGDLLLITALIHQFGATSPFSAFYLIVIIVASSMLGQRAGVAVASAAYLLYAGLLLALAFGWATSPAGGVEEGLSARLIYSLLVHLFGFFAVAHLTSYLTRRALRAEDALEVQRDNLAALQVVHRDIVESIPSGICTTGLGGLVSTLNRTGREILGLGDVLLTGEHIASTGLFTPDQWQQITTASGDHGKLRSEVRVERREGPVEVGFSISRLTDGEGEHRGYIVIFQDLTRWRKLEEEVRIKDRMAAVGELAAGIAHEIGNPLAAISGSVQMLSRSTEPRGGDAKLLEILLKESQRLDRTIKGFLRFARPKDRSSVHFDIAGLLAENVELLRNSAELAEDHVVELDVDPPAATIVGDPDQISQIFWNLARNGLKAMPRGGRLTIVGRLDAERYAMRFVDTGRGMSEEERANLFHPFQSFFDNGTGIGMAIVYRIVQEHGGRLAVESAPGCGSTITVELPTVPVPVELVS